MRKLLYAIRLIGSTVLLPSVLLNLAIYYMYNGAFKWTIAIANDTFYGTDRDLWYGDTEDQTYMGSWADGTAIRRAAVMSNDIVWE